MERRVQGATAGSVGTFFLRESGGPPTAAEGPSGPGYPWTPSGHRGHRARPIAVGPVEGGQELVTPALQTDGPHPLAPGQLGQGVGAARRDADELGIVQHDVRRHRRALRRRGAPFPERLHVLLSGIGGLVGLSRRDESQVVACTRTSEPKGTLSRALPTSTMAAASVTSTTVPEWPPCSSTSPMTAATTGVVGPGRGGVARAPRRPGGD